MLSRSDGDGWPDIVRRGAARFGIDPRALAALRIALGLLLLADLAWRSRDLVAHYSDAGVLPRAVLRATHGGLASLSFAHGLSGSAWVQGALFALAGGFAVALLLGYRTRLAALGSFVLLVSLHARNPVLLNAGDSLLRRLLFWGLFLPLGGRWSVDARRAGRRHEPVASLATVAVLLQVVLVYLVNGVLKLRGEAWLSGEAILIVFELDHLTVGLGDLLAGAPLLLEAFGLLWLAMLLVSPLLVALWGWPRAAFAGLFAAMHLGMAGTMRLGLFPLISVAGLLVFLPPRTWDAIVERLAPAIDRRFDVPAGWRSLDRRLPALPRPTLDARSRRRVHLGAQVVVAALLVFVLAWNAASLGYGTMPDGVRTVADPVDRRWDMFAPTPRTNDGWFVAPAERASGGTIDAWGGGPVSWDRPPELAATYPSHRWFVYLLELPRHGSAPLRAAFADYLCRRYAAEHPDELTSVRLVFVEEAVRLDAPDRTRRIGLGEYACPTG
ncbi:MAG: HTTM domain-containing protein [Halobacteriales archaeon]|nr:HTTM domain-containing protein [Halobacteriales archaeon]